MNSLTPLLNRAFSFTNHVMQQMPSTRLMQQVNALHFVSHNIHFDSYLRKLLMEIIPKVMRTTSLTEHLL